MAKFSDLASAVTCLSTHNANLLLIGASLKNICLLELTVNLLRIGDKHNLQLTGITLKNYCLLEYTVNLLSIGDKLYLLLTGVIH
jgi:hypothetical protein